jgi:hypothetical protein
VTTKISDVQVIPWEEDTDRWGVSYRLSGHLIAKSVGTREEAEHYAAGLRSLKMDNLASPDAQ